MFIGHFAVAFLMAYLFPSVPIWVDLIAVSFPDLLWAAFVPLRIEELRVDPMNPLQSSLQFRKLPYSHSLVLTNTLSLLVGMALAVILGNLLVAPVFVLGSASHWVLDIIVHYKDLPILGFDGDKKLGLGLWRWGPIAFFLELIIYVLAAVAFLPSSAIIYSLLIGIVFHLVNANSFFGFTKKQPFPTANSYAALTLFGFGAMIILGAFLF
jgi:hypothetical protein